MLGEGRMRRIRLTMIIAVAILALACVFAGVLRVAVVSGDSMAPAYHNGQIVLAIRSNWARSGPRKGRVALVRHGSDVLIKRVAYLPGDIINPPDSDALSRVSLFFDKAPASPKQAAQGERLRVPPGQVVVLGDNRPVSDDSRTFGPVAISDILGYVLSDPAHR
jgi:signal peptidase I